jgi:hypothetical protein
MTTRTVDERLRAAAKLFEERNAAYGSNYRTFGDVMMAMLPGPVVLDTAVAHRRFVLFSHQVTKLTRYAQNLQRGQGHLDSLEDLAVYSLMQAECDDEAAARAAPTSPPPDAAAPTSPPTTHSTDFLVPAQPPASSAPPSSEDVSELLPSVGLLDARFLLTEPQTLASQMSGLDKSEVLAAWRLYAGGTTTDGIVRGLGLENRLGRTMMAISVMRDQFREFTQRMGAASTPPNNSSVSVGQAVARRLNADYATVEQIASLHASGDDAATIAAKTGDTKWLVDLVLRSIDIEVAYRQLPPGPGSDLRFTEAALSEEARPQAPKKDRRQK